MTTLKKIDASTASSLKSLTMDDSVAQNLLLMLTLRERNMGKTNLYRFKKEMIDEGFKFTDEEYKSAWEKLVDLNLGVIKRPRKVDGKIKGFEEFYWDYNLTDVANIAFNQNEVEKFKKDHAPKVADATPKPVIIDEVVAAPQVQEASKAKRGRPVGSKNKPKKVGRPKGSKNIVKTPTVLKTLNKQEIKVLQSLLSRLAG